MILDGVPRVPGWMAFPKHFGKGPLISAGVQKGWLPKLGYLIMLSIGYQFGMFDQIRSH